MVECLWAGAFEIGVFNVLCEFRIEFHTRRVAIALFLKDFDPHELVDFQPSDLDISILNGASGDIKGVAVDPGIAMHSDFARSFIDSSHFDLMTVGAVLWITADLQPALVSHIEPAGRKRLRGGTQVK